MLKRSEAIVLKTSLFSEADLIVTFLSDNSGLIRAFAKSPRKIKSRFGSSLEPLTYSRIAYWGKEDASLPRLTQSDIIKPFQPIRERLGTFLRVSEMIEVTLLLLPERDPHPDVFLLLREVLGMAEDNCLSGQERTKSADRFISSLVVYYKVKLLDFLGYGPLLEGCARCGSGGRDFYVSHGSVLCSACACGTDQPLRLSGGVVKLYDTLRRWDAGKLVRIKPSDALMAELSAFLDAHFSHTAPTPFKTRPWPSVGAAVRMLQECGEMTENLDRTR